MIFIDFDCQRTLCPPQESCLCLSPTSKFSQHASIKNDYSTFLCHNCFPRIIPKLSSSLQHDLTALVHFVPLLTFVVLLPAFSLCIYRSYLHFVAVREHIIILIFKFQKTSCLMRFLSRLDPVNVLADAFVNLISQQTVNVFASGCFFFRIYHLFTVAIIYVYLQEI